MADAVAAALRDGKHLVAEAGTGVGKSFAYLVPAILAVADAEDAKDRAGGKDEPGPKRLKKIVVSTHTISLQEQLLHKDLPLLNAVIPLEFTAVLVKGRHNYVSLRRLDTALSRATSLFSTEEELEQLRSLRDWSKITADGSLSDLTYRPSGSVWDEAASDSGTVWGRNARRTRSASTTRRAAVFNAQILVVNHALFFSDLALRRAGASILPKYDAVIFDEAHTLEAVAADHLGISVSSGQIQYILNKLYNDRSNKGLLVHHRCGDEQRQTLRCSQLADDFFRDVNNWLDEQSEKNGRVHTPEIVGNSLSPALEQLAAMLRQRSSNLKDEAQRQDFVSAYERLTALAGDLEVWLGHGFRKRCTGSTFAVVPRPAAAQAGGGPDRRRADASQGVVRCYAQRDPDQRHPGQRRQGVRLLQVPHRPHSDREPLPRQPVRLRRQAQLVLLDGMPDPRRTPSSSRRAIEMIRRYVARSDGRAFVLFTSYEMMRRAASALTPWLAEQDLALHSQADGVPRHQMLERFKSNRARCCSAPTASGKGSMCRARPCRT